MRYIKMFESFGTKKYWRIPLDNVLVALDKIGFPKKDQKELLNQYYSDLNDEYKDEIRKDYMYVAYDPEDNSDTNWYYNIDNKQDEYFNIRGYSKQPNLEITKQDIEDWQIKNKAEKYNL